VHPRFMRDVNGDGVLDITGYGDAGVLVSASAPLYCCDATFYPDPKSSLNVVNGAMARVFIPSAFSSIVMPGLNPNVCPTQPYIDQYHPVGPNSGQSQSWLNVSWRTELGARFAVNANFFNLNHGPQQYPCSVAVGLTISNGVLVSPYSDFNGQPTSTLVIYNLTTAASKKLNAEILPGTTVSSNWQGTVQFAFSGMNLIQNGVAVPSEPDPNSGRARTAVGITKDGKTLLFVVQNNGHDGDGPANESASLPAMANALLRMGAYNALNLDGSGSAQYWFKNNVAEFKSLPSDYSGAYRGIPVAFGIK
jgi:Phosphodiester glycosidase